MKPSRYRGVEKTQKEINDVLDKIRAEIMKLQTYKMFEGEDTVYVECEDVLQVIDKYRSEGSGEE